MNRDRRNVRTLWVAIFCWVAAITLHSVNEKPAPRLIGIGCAGASGPIYANEESDFPICNKIERLAQ